jgi:hypothetical protein
MFPSENHDEVVSGMRWETYLRYAANYYQLQWGILTNGLLLQVFSYGNRNNDTPLVWSDLDETIRNQRLEGFYSLHKILSSLRSQRIGFDQDHATPHAGREYWEKRAHHGAMAVVDAMIDIVGKVDEPRVSYTKSRIAIGTSGREFMWLQPRKAAYSLIRFQVDDDRDSLIAKFEETGIECKKGRRPHIARINLTLEELEGNKQLISDAIQMAESYSH